MKTYVFSDAHNCGHTYVRLADHDAALRRAKAEGMREAAKQARKGATLWSAGMKEREAAALDEFAVWLDARAAQIEEGGAWNDRI